MPGDGGGLPHLVGTNLESRLFGSAPKALVITPYSPPPIGAPSGEVSGSSSYVSIGSPSGEVSGTTLPAPIGTPTQN
jgi:hypothetical protein